MASPAGQQVNAITLGFTVIAGATVFLRIFTRLALVRQAGFEDACITFAMILSIGLAVTISEQARDGMGMHIVDLSERQIINSQKAFWVSLWMYNLARIMTKISVLLQYLHLFPTRRFRSVCYVVLDIVAVYGVWTLVGNLLICAPIDFFWNKAIPGGKCLNEFTIWITNGGVNIGQDIVILILPISVLRSLNLQKGQKRALMVMFALGGFVCLVSIIRLSSLLRISNSTDPTFDNPPAATYSVVECNLSIICACLPYMRPLLSTMPPTYFPKTASRFVRPDDEERGKHIRTGSIGSQLYIPREGSISGHSRTSSKSSSKSSLYRTESDTARLTNEGDMGDMYKNHANVVNATTFVKGHTRKVTVGSSIGSERMLPFSPNAQRLPRPPEESHQFGFREQAGQPRYSVSIHGPRTPRAPQLYRPQSPLARKPLPVTPFPVERK